MVVDACLASNNPPFFVFFSSTAVYGQLDQPADENQTCHPVTVYGKSKLAAEKYLLDQIGEDKIRGCILRPSAIIGEGSDRVQLLVRELRAISIC